MLSDAWQAYRSGFQEVRHLLRLAASAPATPMSGCDFSEQQVYLRAAIVLLAAHVEGFLRVLPEEHADGISGAWDRQRPGVRRYIALSALRRFAEDLEEIRLSGCQKPGEVEAVRRTVIAASRWFAQPRRVSENKSRPQLTGFYRQRGAKAVDSLLMSFSPDGTAFFEWIGERGFDRSRFWTVMEGLVEARNIIAHGNGNPSLSLGDVRQYLAVCTVMVRQVVIFVSQ